MAAGAGSSEAGIQDRLNGIDGRLDGIHQELSVLAKAVQKLAAIEEQITTVFRDQERLATRVEKQDDRLRTLEIAEASSNRFSRAVERGVWILITAAVGLFFAGLSGKI